MAYNTTMSHEDKLAEEIANIQALGKEHKDIDTTALINNLFARQTLADTLTPGEKTKAYLVSLLFPPFGLIYMVKFFLRDQVDARRAAWICLALTVLAGIIMIMLTNAILSAVPGVNEIQNVNLKQLQELTQ